MEPGLLRYLLQGVTAFNTSSTWFLELADCSKGSGSTSKASRVPNSVAFKLPKAMTRTELLKMLATSECCKYLQWAQWAPLINAAAEGWAWLCLHAQFGVLALLVDLGKGAAPVVHLLANKSQCLLAFPAPTLLQTTK
jgi:hypothetical protein